MKGNLMKEFCNDPPPAEAVCDTVKLPSFCALSLDTAKYQHYLADYELTEAQQAELLGALWAMMKTFVELGFGIDPVQQIFAVAVAKAIHDDVQHAESAADLTCEMQVCSKNKGELL